MSLLISLPLVTSLSSGTAAVQAEDIAVGLASATEAMMAKRMATRFMMDAVGVSIAEDATRVTCDGKASQAIVR